MGLYFAIYHALFMTIVFLIYQVRLKKVTILTYLLLIWVISSIASIFFYLSDPLPFKRLSLLPYFYFELCFIITIYPIAKFNTNSISHIRIRNIRLYNYFIVLLSVVAIIPFIENLIQVISTYSNSNSAALFNLYSEKIVDGFNAAKNAKWLSPIGLILNSVTLKFQPIGLLLLFYYLTKPNKNKYLLGGVIIACLNPILFGMAMAGRGAITFFILTFIFMVLLFKNLLNPSVRKKIFFYSSVFCILGILGLSVMTLVRYNESFAYASIFDWINLYLGEGTLNFNSKMWHIRQNTLGDNSFSFFSYYVNENAIVELVKKEEYWSESKTGVDPVRFYTYIGDIFSDLGPYFTLIFLLFISIIVRKLTKKKRVISFTSLYAFITFYYMILCGFTIYPYKQFPITQNVIIGFILCFIFDFKFRTSRYEKK